MMLRDFSLVVPTYNRHQQVKALLHYLRDVPMPVLILDSSDTKMSAEEYGRRIQYDQLGTNCGGSMVYQYPSDYHPWEKFLDGVSRAETEFVAICADDDLMFPDGLEACVEALRDNPKAAAVRGWAGSFDWKGDIIELAGTRVMPPPVLGASPLLRLAAQIGDYHALIYGVHRTKSLLRALQATKPMQTLLGCELLSAAMSVVDGQVLAVSVPVHMRSMGKSVYPYKDWHPLEMFIQNSPVLGAEYKLFRDALVPAIVGHPDNYHTEAEVGRAVDAIMLGYLLHNSPAEVLDYLIGRKARGDKPEGFLPKELQQVLLKTSLVSQRHEMDELERNAWMARMAGYAGISWNPVPVTADERVGEAWA